MSTWEAEARRREWENERTGPRRQARGGFPTIWKGQAQLKELALGSERKGCLPGEKCPHMRAVGP